MLPAAVRVGCQVAAAAGASCHVPRSCLGPPLPNLRICSERSSAAEFFDWGASLSLHLPIMQGGQGHRLPVMVA